MDGRTTISLPLFFSNFEEQIVDFLTSGRSELKLFLSSASFTNQKKKEREIFKKKQGS